MKKAGCILRSICYCVGLLIVLCGSVNVRADHLLPQHNLQCSAEFPCSPALSRRVDFWIQVFKEWGKEMAILHDPNNPERVYRVIKTGNGCGKSASRKIKANRKSIAASLEALATNLAKKRSVTDANQKHFLTLFPKRSPAEIRRAAKEIRCQGGVKDSFIKGLQRFNQYSGLVDKVLAKYNLPKQIRYLPFVESSYNPGAYSKVGAAGLWQIMPATARSLGLELSATLDERLDPEAATEAAAKYLVQANKSLSKAARAKDAGISQGELNPFVITSYNYGVNGMRRAINKVGPDFMQVLDKYKSPSFRIAVKNFYASFLAASHVAQNANRYFGNVKNQPGSAYQTLVLQHATSMDRIKSVFNLRESDLKPLNRPLTRYIWNGWRLIPAGYKLHLPARNHRWQKQITALKGLAAEKVVPGGDRYVVRKGDTACGIARALRVNCRTLIRANNLGKRATIRIGQKLVIPHQFAKSDKNSSQSKKTNQSGYVKEWTVKKGDTACGIARSTATSCRELISLNRLGRKARIKIGQKLKIPGGDFLPQNAVGLNADNRYIVKKGDVACKIAKRFAVSCNQLVKINKLNKRATIYPGQKLKIPGLESQKTTDTAVSLANENDAASNTASLPKKNDQAVRKDAGNNLTNLLDVLPDLSIRVSTEAAQPIYFIYVEVDETLGHYADWLGIGRSAGIRKMNKIRGNSQLKLGQKILLPKPSTKALSRFEQLRIDYHQVLSENLKENFELVGIETYQVKKGDSLWELSRRRGFPLWLLYRLNSGLQKSGLTAGKKYSTSGIKATPMKIEKL